MFLTFINGKYYNKKKNIKIYTANFSFMGAFCQKIPESIATSCLFVFPITFIHMLTIPVSWCTVIISFSLMIDRNNSLGFIFGILTIFFRISFYFLFRIWHVQRMWWMISVMLLHNLQSSQFLQVSF